MKITHGPDDGPLPVVVGVTIGPSGTAMVLIQLPDSWVVTTGEGARALAAALYAAADDLG